MSMPNKGLSIYLADSYNALDRNVAFSEPIKTDKLPLGIFYTSPDKLVFEETLVAYTINKEALNKRTLVFVKFQKLIDSYK